MNHYTQKFKKKENTNFGLSSGGVSAITGNCVEPEETKEEKEVERILSLASNSDQFLEAKKAPRYQLSVLEDEKKKVKNELQNLREFFQSQNPTQSVKYRNLTSHLNRIDKRIAYLKKMIDFFSPSNEISRRKQQELIRFQKRREERNFLDSQTSKLQKNKEIFNSITEKEQNLEIESRLAEIRKKEIEVDEKEFQNSYDSEKLNIKKSCNIRDSMELRFEQQLCRDFESDEEENNSEEEEYRIFDENCDYFDDNYTNSKLTQFEKDMISEIMEKDKDEDEEKEDLKNNQIKKDDENNESEEIEDISILKFEIQEVPEVINSSIGKGREDSKTKEMDLRGIRRFSNHTKDDKDIRKTQNYESESLCDIINKHSTHIQFVENSSNNMNQGSDILGFRNINENYENRKENLNVQNNGIFEMCNYVNEEENTFCSKFQGETEEFNVDEKIGEKPRIFFGSDDIHVPFIDIPENNRIENNLYIYEDKEEEKVEGPMDNEIGYS